MTAIDKLFETVMTGLVCSCSAGVIGLSFSNNSWPVGIACVLIGFTIGARAAWKRDAK